MLYDSAGTDGKNSSVGFGKSCVGECDRSDPGCTKSATILGQRNPTCDVRTYRGGLACCHHLYYLTDKNQSGMIPPEELVYHMKARFYFQEYEPAKHTQLYRWHWQVCCRCGCCFHPSHADFAPLSAQTAMGAGEYDIPQCAPGTPTEQCIHKIEARIQVSPRSTRPPASQPDSIVGRAPPRCWRDAKAFALSFFFRSPVLSAFCSAASCRPLLASSCAAVCLVLCLVRWNLWPCQDPAGGGLP